MSQVEVNNGRLRTWKDGGALGFDSNNNHMVFTEFFSGSFSTPERTNPNTSVMKGTVDHQISPGALNAASTRFIGMVRITSSLWPTDWMCIGGALCTIDRGVNTYNSGSGYLKIVMQQQWFEFRVSVGILYLRERYLIGGKQQYSGGETTFKIPPLTFAYRVFCGFWN